MESPHFSQSEIDVLTIGHALVDVLAGADDELLVSEGLTKGIMHLIDHERATTLYQSIGPGSETSGGSAANTAAGVVACGGSAAFIGTVANDQLGEIFSHDIRAAGVWYRTPPLEVDNGTGRCIVLVSPDSERTMSTYIGVSDKIAFEHLNEKWLSSSAVTYVEGYLFDDVHPVSTWLDVVKIVHDAGKKFSITLSDPFCVERHRDLFLAMLDGSVDICFGNEEEVCRLFETDNLDVAATELAKRCEIAAITKGSKGSILISGDERVEIPAEPVVVIDTTGAGDLYASGVLAGLTRGMSLAEAGKLGGHAAATVISHMGARLGKPLD